MASDDTAKIAQRYAKALFLFAESASALDAAEKDLLGLKKLLEDSEMLSRLTTSPLLSRISKADALDALLAKLKAHDAIRRFTRQLAMAGRLEALPAIIAAFESLMMAHRGEIVLDVISAKPLPKDATDALAKAYGKKVRLRTSIDESLIGGAVVQSGGKRMDYSIKNKIARLARSLKNQQAA